MPSSSKYGRSVTKIFGHLKGNSVFSIQEASVTMLSTIISQLLERIIRIAIIACNYRRNHKTITLTLVECACRSLELEQSFLDVATNAVNRYLGASGNNKTARETRAQITLSVANIENHVRAYMGQCDENKNKIVRLSKLVPVFLAAYLEAMISNVMFNGIHTMTSSSEQRLTVEHLEARHYTTPLSVKEAEEQKHETTTPLSVQEQKYETTTPLPVKTYSLLDLFDLKTGTYHFNNSQVLFNIRNDHVYNLLKPGNDDDNRGEIKHTEGTMFNITLPGKQKRSKDLELTSDNYRDVLLAFIQEHIDKTATVSLPDYARLPLTDVFRISKTEPDSEKKNNLYNMLTASSTMVTVSDCLDKEYVKQKGPLGSIEILDNGDLLVTLNDKRPKMIPHVELAGDDNNPWWTKLSKKLTELLPDCPLTVRGSNTRYNPSYSHYNQSEPKMIDSFF